MIDAGSALTPAERRAAHAVRYAMGASRMLCAVARMLDTLDEHDIAQNGARYAATVARCAKVLDKHARIIAAAELAPYRDTGTVP